MGFFAQPPLIEALPGHALWRRAMDLKLKDKVALITGSSRGIGLATAKAFAAEGCCLVLSARSPEPLAAAEAALRADGVAVASCLADGSCPCRLRINLPGSPVDPHRSKKAWTRELAWLPSGPLSPGDVL